MERDIKKMTDGWLVEIMFGTIKYPLELRKQCEREYNRRERIKMSRKHYESIARLIKKRSPKNHWSFNVLVRDLCETFKADNPRFNESKFIKACGL